MQIVQMREDLRTIDKAMEMIKNLSKNCDPQALNQVTRWITSKESHAQNIQKITSEYFLTQRIKQSSKEMSKHGCRCDRKAHTVNKLMSEVDIKTIV